MVNKKRTVFKVSGVGEILSIEEMARLSGRSIESIYYRRGLGASDDDIFYKPSINYCYINGVRYQIPKRVIESNGISYNSVRYHLGRGLTIDDFFGDKPFPKKRKGTPVIVRGIAFDNIQQAYSHFIKEVKVSYLLIKQRILEYGWHPDKAFFADKMM